MAREYYLISKCTNMLYAKYNGDALRISKEFPHRVDEIVVGKYGTNKQRKITTFKDPNGEIIERAFDYSDKPYKNVLYNRQNHTIGEDEFIESTTKRQFILEREYLTAYKDFQKQYAELGLKTYFWDLIKTETEHLSQNINSGIKILSKTSVDFFDKTGKLFHRFIEYPHLLAKKLKNNTYKLLYFETDKEYRINPNTIFEDNVKFPKNDSFITYRALDIESAKTPITKKFLKDRKIDTTGITIDTDYIPPDDEVNQLSACFIASDGSINFNKLYTLKSKIKLIGTARHEVEHGWQYYLDARNYAGATPWQRYVYETFGPIPEKNKSLQAEADKCTDAIDNYVTYKEDYEKYKNNYIEIEAEKKAKTAQNKYSRQGKKLAQEFPHIPQELLWFFKNFYTNKNFRNIIITVANSISF